MHCTKLLAAVLFVCSLCFVHNAKANPFDFTPLYTAPTYLVFAGTDTANVLRYATVYIDPQQMQYENELWRHFYARYVSGNIYGSMENIDGIATDFAQGKHPGNDQPEGDLDFPGANGYFVNDHCYMSSVPVGDVFRFSNDIYDPNDDFTMTLVSALPAENVTAPVPEPATCLFIGAGLLGIWGARRRWQ